MKKISRLKDIDLEQLFEASIDLLCIADVKGNLLSVNYIWEETFGFKSEELEGNPIIDFVHPDDVKKAMNITRRLLKNEKVPSFTMQFRSKSGEYKHVEWKVTNFGSIFFGSGHDITDRVIAMRELEESERRYRFITENITDVIWILDVETLKLIYVSPSVQKMRGFTLDEIYSQNLQNIMSTESYNLVQKILPQKLKEFKEKGTLTPVTTLIQQRTKLGKQIWTEIIASLHHGPDGKLVVMGVSRDITKSLEAEQEIKSKNEELTSIITQRDKFFSIVAHDLRSPFAGLLSFSDFLIEDLTEKNYNSALEMGIKLQSIIKDMFEFLETLLEWAVIQRKGVKFYPVNISLKKNVEQAEKLFMPKAENKHLKIINLVKDDIEVFADSHMLSTVIRNLISNAIKFTRRDGVITVNAQKENNLVEVSVSDTGIGMPDEISSRLFSIEHNVKRRGTEDEESAGIGLLLCKEYIERNGGKIRFVTEINKGTTFYFTVPLSLSEK